MKSLVSARLGRGLNRTRYFSRDIWCAMSHDKTDAAGPVSYKGYQIVLIPSQHDDGTWQCQYLIHEVGLAEICPSQGHADGNFPSREAAELAAVQKEEAVIDLR